MPALGAPAVIIFHRSEKFVCGDFLDSSSPVVFFNLRVSSLLRDGVTTATTLLLSSLYINQWGSLRGLHRLPNIMWILPALGSDNTRSSSRATPILPIWHIRVSRSSKLFRTCEVSRRRNSRYAAWHGVIQSAGCVCTYAPEETALIWGCALTAKLNQAKLVDFLVYIYTEETAEDAVDFFRPQK